MIYSQNVHYVIEIIPPITVDVKFLKIYNSEKQQSHTKKKINTNKIKGNTNYNINTLSNSSYYNYTLLINNKWLSNLFRGYQNTNDYKGSSHVSKTNSETDCMTAEYIKCSILRYFHKFCLLLLLHHIVYCLFFDKIVPIQ